MHTKEMGNKINPNIKFHKGDLPSAKVSYDFDIGAELMADARDAGFPSEAFLMILGPRWENGSWMTDRRNELSIWVVVLEKNKKAFQEKVPPDWQHQINVWLCESCGVEEPTIE